MYAREIYGLMMAGAMLLMTSCSADDVVKETTSEEAIAISFSCNYDNQEEHPTRAGHEGLMNTEDLYTTGFGVMASTTAGTDPEDNKPDLMYNQKVEFTFVGDMTDPLKGYWSYSPLKYWPTDLTHCYISAYAPYVEQPIANPGTTTGIYGISANNVPPYVDYRRCDKPSEVVDLLWYYEKPTAIPAKTAQKAAGILDMKMRHALARLEIKVALAAAPASGTKVLIEKITLTGQMAKTGRLHLYEQTTEGSGNDIKYYPVWSDQTYDLDHSIKIKNKDNDSESYGIIESQVRYIPNLPYGWQPAGLSTTLQNALSTGDRTGYVYLIPQPSATPAEGDPTGLSLTVKVTCKKWVQGEEGQPTTYIKATNVDVTPTAVANPLKGNTTYTLNLTLSGI